MEQTTHSQRFFNRYPNEPASDNIRPLDSFTPISTTVLSEGQSLQDCHIMVNYDLPWAIIHLVQRAGRVDRIGQQAEQILCYSFLPAEGVDQIIRLRARVHQRLHENSEVVGSNERFLRMTRRGRTSVICTLRSQAFSIPNRIQRLILPPTLIRYG